MSQRTEPLDFSALFKLDVLVHLDISAYSFYELGLKKFLALSSDKELVFLYINQLCERFEHKYDWDFLDNPVHCLCFEPSGTWVLIVSDQKVLLVPFLPLFIPQNTFDCKWSLTSVTVLPLGNISKPTTVAWWLTKESENIIIIAAKNGGITFYSLESENILAECKVPDEITDLQICYDDSLDLLTLLITGVKSQQWKLILEHRSFGYNWLQQSRNATDKRDSFMSYIKQLSKDKITLFTQGGSKDSKLQTVEYVLKPTEYLPAFRKGSNNWALTAQYVNGRHFLTAFEVNEGTIILESPEQEVPSRTFRPQIKKDGLYNQGLWSPRLIYLLRNEEVEVHSSSFSVIQGEGLLASRDYTLLWSAELIGEVLRAFVVSTREPTTPALGWREPTFLCDLQLPRFNLEQCLIITTQGAYLLNTVCEPSEWLVGMIMRGGGGAEQSAAALGAPVATLLRASADMLLARGKLAPAHYLYSLSQCEQDGWVARLGVFGRLQELSMFKQPTGNAGGLGSAAVTLKLLANLLKVANNSEELFDTAVKLTNLTTIQLEELCSIAAAVGLWDLVPTFSIYRGNPGIVLTAMKTRGVLCRGAIDCLLKQRVIVPMLLEENGQWLLDVLSEKCCEFDTKILKCLCLWLCPLQHQLNPVMRDLKQGITTIYTTRMLQLIKTFMHITCAIEARNPTTELSPELPTNNETWVNQFTPRRSLSCGLAHWAIADEGNAKIILANTPVNTELIGRVISVSCGRHHTLVLTENGVYAAGDNSYGQLGVGSSWPCVTGDNASQHGTLLLVPYCWPNALVQVSAGHYHSAALDVGGRLFTWGWGVHGQLGLGSIDDEWTPQLVTKLQGRKVLSVGCGALHTAVLMKNGEVWSFGAGAFGQLGTGHRDKSCVPVRVPVPEPVQMIAVGYLHTVALTTKQQVFTWGGSPQSIRAAHARRGSPAERVEPHLAPALLPTHNVIGTIVQIAAGWHHSCLLNNAGSLYTWGLNFDGQLGSGDRKQIQIPTEIRINRETPSDNAGHSCAMKTGCGLKPAHAKATEAEIANVSTKALVACGGDFTIYIDDDGRIYSSGNSHLVLNKDLNEAANRIIMMKTTKRVIKIPASRSNNKCLCFSQIDRIDIMFPFDVHASKRTTIKPHQNPLASLADFKRKTWPDEVITLLKPWINETCLNNNSNMAAKLAYRNQKYSQCLRLLLDNLKSTKQDDKLYLAHTEFPEDELNKDAKYSSKKDELKIVVTNIMSKRIKEISLSILNEQPYPSIDLSLIKSIPCCCEELKYVPIRAKPVIVADILDVNLSVQAANIIDKCMSVFPVDADLWETCFRFSKNFYLENGLSVVELETVLRKYMELNATTMASAIMYSNDCVEYNRILSPKFYLNMCGEIMDAWS